MKTRRSFILEGGAAAAGLLSPLPLRANASSAAVRVNAAEIVNRVPDLSIGVNLEDLNYQVYGGLYSQLLYAENFQEHVDSSVLGLTGRDRLQVFVEESPAGEVQVWGWDGRHWKHNLARKILGLPQKDDRLPVALSELPGDKREALVRHTTHDEQVSRHWEAFLTGSAQASFRFERLQPLKGRQSQRLEFLRGTGEAGIDNAGLNRWGINLVAGKVYEGHVRVLAEQGATVHFSLASADGMVTLAHAAVDVHPSPEYQRLQFELTPKTGDTQGRFRIGLREPASIAIGYALLQAGPWGRYKSLPIRPDLIEALFGQGVRVVRYDGAMVNQCPQPELYKWKEMIGPADLRRPYHGTFNPYASHGFGIFDFLNLAEAAAFLPVPGVRADETPQDMADFVEYVNGPPDSTWGKRRAADGHPAPYNLRHLEIGNEERLDELYCQRFESIAGAIWSRDPDMVLLVACSVRSLAGNDIWTIGPNGELSPQLKNAARLVRFAQDSGHSIWWDNHDRADDPEHAGEQNNTISSMGALKQSLAQLVPGYRLVFTVLEENGSGHNMNRALAHARNVHALARMGSDLAAIAVANAFQAWQQDLLWPQGNTFFTPAEVWFQAGYYIDQARSRHRAPNVVEVAVEGPHNLLDVLAKLSDDRHTLVLQVVNIGAAEIPASLRLHGFLPRGTNAQVEEIAGDPASANTLDQPRRIAPRMKVWKHTLAHHADSYRFPPYSFTQITLR